MANSLVTNKHVKLFAAAVEDACPYLAESQNMFPDAFTGKKNGQTVMAVLTDRGTITSGIDITGNVGEVKQVEVPVVLANKTANVGLDIIERSTGIEDFVTEVAEPNGRALAEAVQKDVIDANIWTASGAVVTNDPDFGTLSAAAALLKNVKAGGKLVGFLNPTDGGLIAASGLGLFQAANAGAQKLYSENLLGAYAGVNWVNLPDLPTIVAGTATIAGTVTTAVTEGGDEIAITGTFSNNSTVKKGSIFKIAGVKTVNLNGTATNEDKMFVVLEDASTTTSAVTLKVKPIFASGAGKNVSALPAKDAVVSSPLTAGKTYSIGQVRDKDALIFGQYSFSRMEDLLQETAKAGKFSVTMTKGSDVLKMSTVYRFDFPYAAKIADERLVRNIYIQLD